MTINVTMLQAPVDASLSHGIVAGLEWLSTLASIRQVKGSIPLACICKDIKSISVELKVSEISCTGIY
jgi:hypothetical protein